MEKEGGCHFITISFRPLTGGGPDLIRHRPSISLNVVKIKFRFWYLTEYATVGYMAKRIQMRKNRFLAIQKIAEQKKGGGGGGHDGHGHSHSHHSHHHGHGSITGGHGTLSGHGTLTAHGNLSGHSALSHNLSAHGLQSSHGSHGYDGHRHSHGGHSGTLPGPMLSGDVDHAPRQTVSVAVNTTCCLQTMIS